MIMNLMRPIIMTQEKIDSIFYIQAFDKNYNTRMDVKNHIIIFRYNRGFYPIVT